LIEPRDHEVRVLKRIATQGLLNVFPGKNGKTQPKLLEKFILPLIDQATGGRQLGYGRRQPA
jgi:hypothetical protein